MQFIRSTTATLDVLRIGSEKSPVILIDNLLQDPAMLVRCACERAEFEDVTGNLYPGVRAPMPLDYVKGAVQALDPLIRANYAVEGARLAGAECFFSIVTKRAEALSPLQKIPHIDTTSAADFAVVHFLCNSRFGGTGFYQQRATGYETISRDREAEWSAARDRALKNMPDDCGYIRGDTEDYRQVGLVQAKFDRLILYPCNLLHSGEIADDMPFSADPAIGRLTANFFISYRFA